VKEAQLHRMNFLRKARYGFTFRDMIYTIAAWYLLLMAIYGIEIFRSYNLDHRIDATKARLTALSTEKDRQVELARTVVKKEGGPAKENLGALLTRRPRWSKVIRGLSQVLPADVWLNDVEVTGGDDQWYMIKVEGRARSQQSLTDFILGLETGGMFLGTTLEKTGQPEGPERIFTYSLQTQPSVQRLINDL